jgi:hypothetical protein
MSGKGAINNNAEDGGNANEPQDVAAADEGEGDYQEEPSEDAENVDEDDDDDDDDESEELHNANWWNRWPAPPPPAPDQFSEDDDSYASSDDRHVYRHHRAFDNWDAWVSIVRDGRDDNITDNITELDWRNYLREVNHELYTQLSAGRFDDETWRISPCYLICLVTDSILLKLLATLNERDVSIYTVVFDLNGLEEAVDALTNIGIGISKKEILEVTKAIADLLGSLATIYTVNFSPCLPYNLPLLSAIVAACRNVRRLSVFFSLEGDEDDGLEDLDDFCTMLPTKDGLEHVDFSFKSASRFHAICATVPLLPDLERCSIHGVSDTSLLMIDTTEDASTIKNLFLIDKRQFFKLELSYFQFCNSQVTEIVCNGIRDSRICSVILEEMSYPENLHGSVATALTSSNIKDLMYSSAPDKSFLVALGKGLQGSAMKQFCFNSLRVPLPGDICASLLQDTQRWSLIHLTLLNLDWTDAFDKALSLYVKENHFLNVVEIDLSDEYTGPIIESPSLLEALDSGTRRVECITIGKCRTTTGPPTVNSAWEDKVDNLTTLNELRNNFNSRNKNIYSNFDAFMDLLEKTEFPFLFEFLRRNEWGLQKLFQKWNREPKITLSGRKRPLETE